MSVCRRCSERSWAPARVQCSGGEGSIPTCRPRYRRRCSTTRISSTGSRGARRSITTRWTGSPNALIVGVDHTGEDGRGLEQFAPPELAPFTLRQCCRPHRRRRSRGTSLTTADYNGDGQVQSHVIVDVVDLARRTVLSHEPERELPWRHRIPWSGRHDGLRHRDRAPVHAGRHRQHDHRRLRAGGARLQRPAVPHRRPARGQQQRLRLAVQVDHVSESERLVGRERGAVLARRLHQHAARCARRMENRDGRRSPSRRFARICRCRDRWDRTPSPQARSATPI